MTAPFTEARLTTDQALLWIATRRTDLVEAASRRIAPSERLTWMLFQVDLTGPIPLAQDSWADTQSAKAVESALLTALQRGEITASYEGAAVQDWWFDEAIIRNRLIKEGSTLDDGEHMVFERRRSAPNPVSNPHGGFQLASLTEVVAPTFEAEQLRAVYRDLASEFPSTVSISQDHRTEIREQPTVVHVPTGAPGRPGARHLVEQQFKVRVSQGIAHTTLSNEARELEAWLEEQRKSDPNIPPLKSPGIQNAIRDAHRAYRSKGHQGPQK